MARKNPPKEKPKPGEPYHKWETVDEPLPPPPASITRPDPVRTGLPFIDPKTGLDPSSDRSKDADERLWWMEKQQEAMKRGE